MHSHSRSRAARAVAAALALALPLAARAALGGDAGSIMRDQEALGATHAVTPGALYTLHALYGADGVELHEYADASGRVFALSWQGPHAPDVGLLLGAASARYLAAARNHRGGHHVLSIREPDLEVSMLRLPRGWRGHALLPMALPLGVSRGDLR
jgi:hypothetical protein